MIRLSRLLRAFSAAVLAAVLGLASHQALAANLRNGSRGVPRVGLPAPAPGHAPSAGQQTGPADIKLPAPVSVAPLTPGQLSAAAPNAAQPASEAGPVQKIAEGVAPQIQQIDKPGSSGESSAAAAENVSSILQGGRSLERADEVKGGSPDPSSGSGARGPQLSKPEAAVPSQSAVPAAPAVETKSVQPVDSALSYELRRWTLRGLNWLSSNAFSLPRTGDKLFERKLEEASFKEAVFSDADDTLLASRGKISKENGEGLTGVIGAGKTMAVITDRPSFEPSPRDVTLLESLSPIPAENRAGIIGATKKDGYIFEYDSKGEPQVLYQEPPFSKGENGKKGEVELIREAADATIAELPRLKTSMKFDDLGALAYGLILKAGTDAKTVFEVRRILQHELAKRKLLYEVEARIPKDPALEPYVAFSKIDKAWAVAHISRLKGIKAEDALILGDNMLAPKAPGSNGLLASWIKRLGEGISGMPAPGNGSDSDKMMERPLPGALTISLGGSADPALSNGYAAPGTWQEDSPRILEAVSSRPAGAKAADQAVRRADTLDTLGAVLVLAAAAALTLVMLWQFSQIFSGLEQQLRQAPDWFENFPR